MGDKEMNQEDDQQVRNQNFIELLASEKTGVHEDTIKVVFNAMWDSICEEIEKGNKVKLHAKGEFYLSKRSSRVGRNPLTGEEFDVPEREAMAFRTSPAYAKRLRKKREQFKNAEKNNNK